MNLIFEKVENLRNLLGMEVGVRKFRKFNKYRISLPHTSVGGILLVETQQPSANDIGLSFFIPQFLKINGGKAIGYSMIPATWTTKFKQGLRHRLSVLSSAGCKEHLLVPSFTKLNKSNYRERIKKEILKVEKLDAAGFENYQIDGVVIGDLIYDVYLRSGSQATLDLKDPIFKIKLIESLNYFFFWQEFFTKNVVSGVCVSHCVYNFAIPLRIALTYDIPGFQVNAESIYRVNSSFPHAYTDFKMYKSEFIKLSKDIREAGTIKAKNRLQLRFSGEVGVDMQYSTKSAFAPRSAIVEQIIPSSRIKVFIAVHDFYDSPHGYGNNFYPDFLIWLDALAKISEITDYDWYIKTHPDLHVVAGETTVRNFVAKNPKFTLLSKETSHFEIINAGIDVVLTVFGTVAMEYSYLGIPVINASCNNPHVAFNFSFTPKDREEYEETLIDLKTFKNKFVIDRNQVEQYYFMAHLHKMKSWTVKDYNRYIEEIGGYRNSTTTKALSYFLKSDNAFSPEIIDKAVGSFLKSQDLLMNSIHFR